MSPPVIATASALTSALVITRAMLTAARREDWEQLLQLEEARAPLVHRQHGDDAVTQAQLGEILACDRQLQALLGSAREALAHQWQRERDRAQAIAAYAQA
ncbi:flagellar protein FliT [Rhodanobacter lindaniclasticus]|nr:flagellar protein FliT [Rhodanobacter lindaniclasticus]